MIEIEVHETDVDADVLRNRLLEEGAQTSFGWKQFVYYNLVRPVLPLALRQKLQKAYSEGRTHLPGFIDESLVSLTGSGTADPYPEDHEFAIVLTHDVEDQEGFDRIPEIIELEVELGFKSSWNIIPYKHKIDEGILRFIREMGHEIGVHGYNHDGKLFSSHGEFRRRVPYINDALDRFGAVGFRAPQVHRNLVWMQELEVEYDASCFDHDPYQPIPGGTGFIWPFRAGKFIELGYTLPQDHTVFYVVDCDPVEVWKRKAEWLMKHHGMILMLTHPDYLDRSRHLECYREFLVYLASLSRGWKCLPKDMARHWKEQVLGRQEMSVTA